MAKKIPTEAMAQAMVECAGHLGMAWTEDVDERKAGDALAKELLERATHGPTVAQRHFVVGGE